MHIDKQLKTGKPIYTYKTPEGWTPHDLITHYIELYRILDTARDQSPSTLTSWLESAKRRADKSFTEQKEYELLKEILESGQNIIYN